MSDFLMPSLGADMEAGTLVQWLKRPGDAVKHGDIIAVVETQKGAIEVEVFEDGVVAEWLVEPGARVPVGTPLARITAAGETAAPPGPSPEPHPMVAPVPFSERPASGAAPAPPPASGRRISPAARRLAAERGIDATGLIGTGPEGAVVSRDLPDKTPVSRGLDLAAMRQAIAAAMARSKREIPHFYLSASLDLSPLLAWLEARNAGQGPEQRLLPAVAYVKAVALALSGYPEFNGFHTAQGFAPARAVHVGMAISLRGGGLVAPALHDVAARSLDELMAMMRDLVLRVRAGSLRSSEISDPTITVSSLGERGVEALWGVIYPPQVALIGFGTPQTRPWVVDGQVQARPVLQLSLAGDHRVADGHRGALFLREIVNRLGEPERL